MLISAHDYQNKFGAPGNTAVTATTPAWAHAWSAQNNVTATVVTKTGGTYALEAPVKEEKTAKKKS
jgi:hypothetical protein